MKRRLLSLLLCISFVLALVPAGRYRQQTRIRSSLRICTILLSGETSSGGKAGHHAA